MPEGDDADVGRVLKGSNDCSYLQQICLGPFSDLSCRYHSFSFCRDAAPSRNQGWCHQSGAVLLESENVLLHVQDVDLRALWELPLKL